MTITLDDRPVTPEVKAARLVLYNKHATQVQVADACAVLSRDGAWYDRVVAREILAAAPWAGFSGDGIEIEGPQND